MVNLKRLWQVQVLTQPSVWRPQFRQNVPQFRQDEKFSSAWSLFPEVSTGPVKVSTSNTRSACLWIKQRMVLPL